MRRNRIDVSLVLTSYKDVPGRPSTRRVIEAVASHPNLHVVAGISYNAFHDGTVDELRGYLTRGEIRGLKLYPGYEPFTRPTPRSRRSTGWPRNSTCR